MKPFQLDQAYRFYDEIWGRDLKVSGFLSIVRVSNGDVISSPAVPFSTEAIMYKEDIVFFDQLGFGWALDERIILKVFSRVEKPEKVSEKVLFNRTYQTK